MIVALFVFMISLLLIHEMDAVRTKEWKMFAVLKDMVDETAYKVFTLIHLPLYFAVIYLMVQGGHSANNILYYVIDVFLLGHSIIHYCFKKNKNNEFTSLFSKAIIYILGVLAVIHICLLAGGF